MIDFRYHLVSIASVFLALAVGIVLGAGPLKGTISDTLTSEVTKLREDANTLRGEVSAAEAKIRDRDDFISTLAPRTVAGLLTGEHVTIVALPDTPDSAIETTRTALTQAGAVAKATVHLEETWMSQEPPDVTDRGEAAADLRVLLSGELPVGVNAERVLALGLATALSGAALDPDAEGAADQTVAPPAASSPADESSPADAPTSTAGPTETPEDGQSEPAADSATTEPGTIGSDDPTVPAKQRASGRASQILNILVERGLLTIDPDQTPVDADALVLLAPSMDKEEADAEADQAQTDGWIDLVRVLAQPGSLILASDVPAEAPLTSNLVAAVRDTGDLTGSVSTVDNLQTPIGRVTLPMALANQLADEVGHFGVLDSAGAVFPDLRVDTP